MDLILKILIYAIPIILAVSLHEAAHGWIAYLLGDPTAKQLGRLTANPIKHIDPIGTILVPAIMVFLIGIPFGWAKPVPVEVRNFANPMKDMALVALAGPLSNLLMAIFWTLVLVFSLRVMPQGTFASLLEVMAEVGVVINLILMTLNLLPVPPLDGGRIVTGVLPFSMATIFVKFEMIGMWIVIFLLASGFLGKILMPMVQAFQLKLYTIFGLG